MKPTIKFTGTAKEFKTWFEAMLKTYGDDLTLSIDLFIPNLKD